MQINGVDPSILPGMVQLNLTMGWPLIGNQTSPIQAVSSPLGQRGPIQASLITMGQPNMAPMPNILLEFVVLVPLSHIAWFVKTCVSLVLYIETPCKL